MWHVLSGYAYLGGNIWFALFSGGLLAPKTVAFKVHVLGVFCRQEVSAVNLSGSGLLVVHRGDEEERRELSAMDDTLPRSLAAATQLHTAVASSEWSPLHVFPRRLDTDEMFSRKSMEVVPEDYEQLWPGAYLGRVRSNSRCGGELLAASFKVLWESIADVRRPESLVLFRDEVGREVLFDLADRTVMQKLVTYKDRWNFLIAVGCNCLMSLVIAVKLALIFFAVLGERYNQPLSKSKNILHNASCRLEHGMGPRNKTSRRTVIVTATRLPADGFCVRWVFKFKCAYNSLSLRLLFVDGHESTTELTFVLDPSRVRTVETLAGSQNEIFLPLRHPDPLLPPEELLFSDSDPWEIPSLARFRLRLEALSAEGKVVGLSSWSPMCVFGARSFATQLVFLMNERFVPQRLSSLSYFVRKHIRRLPIPPRNLV